MSTLFLTMTIFGHAQQYNEGIEIVKNGDLSSKEYNEIVELFHYTDKLNSQIDYSIAFSENAFEQLKNFLLDTYPMWSSLSNYEAGSISYSLLKSIPAEDIPDLFITPYIFDYREDNELSYSIINKIELNHEQQSASIFYTEYDNHLTNGKILDVVILKKEKGRWYLLPEYLLFMLSDVIQDLEHNEL